ncbi:MAG: FTR1 family protein [Halioglobus sp.]
MMLVNSVVLILREVLEAAMLISVLLALSLNMRCRLAWFWWSLPVAIVGAVSYAVGLELVTDSLDGAGQEVANAALQILVYCFAVGIVWLCAHGDVTGSRAVKLTLLMAAAVACAMIREGSEILIYITGFAAVEELRTAVYAGSAIGAGIGLSLGVLLFSALRALEASMSKITALVLLGLIGAGMVMQSTMLLQQVDWLPMGASVWDSEALISEQSIGGELLYAVFGYESSPSFIQVLLYGVSLFLMVVTYTFSRRGEVAAGEI